MSNQAWLRAWLVNMEFWLEHYTHDWDASRQVICYYMPECVKGASHVSNNNMTTHWQNNTEDGQHVSSRASQALTVTHLTPSNERKFWGSAETRSGQRRQHKSLIPCDNFRLLQMQSSVRLTFCYYPWTPRHQLITIPYNLLYCWLCRVASDLHSPQHTVDSKAP